MRSLQRRGVGGTGDRCHAPRREAGFTYLGVMFLIVLMGIALAGTGQFWSLASQREKEQRLLWVGDQYVRALRSYHARSPGRKTWPVTLDELVEDNRFPNPMRHLRRLYPDPLAPELDWELIRNSEGRIVGLHSQEPGVPLKQANFPLAWEDFAGMQRYADWRFVADAALRGPRVDSAAVAANSAATPAAAPATGPAPNEPPAPAPTDRAQD